MFKKICFQKVCHMKKLPRMLHYMKNSNNVQKSNFPSPCPILKKKEKILIFLLLSINEECKHFLRSTFFIANLFKKLVAVLMNIWHLLFF